MTYLRRQLLLPNVAGAPATPALPPDQIAAVKLWLDTNQLAAAGGGQVPDTVAQNNGTLNNFTGDPFSGLAPPNSLASDSITFDGTDDNITTDREVQFSGGTPFSFSAWCRAPSSGIRAIMTGLPSGTNNGVIMWSGFSDILFSGSALNFFDNPVPFAANTWFHVGATREAGNDCRVYVNGQASASNPLPDTGVFNFGRMGQRDSGNNWNGQLAQIEFFDSSLTQQQFQEIFDGSRTTVPAPIHQWLMDSLTSSDLLPGGNIASWKDAVGSSDASQAVVANQPTYQTSPRRVVFDGFDDFMTLDAPYAIPGPFTSVVWIRSREE